MNQSRGAFTAQISRKRKEREDFFLPSFNGNINNKKKNHHYQVIKGKQVQPLPSFPKTTSSVPKPSESTPVRSNRLLAGYMAHEFLTKGTLMGQIFDPIKNTAPTPTPIPTTTPETYAEVATLLKTDGAHIPGVFNPTQLARWIQK